MGVVADLVSLEEVNAVACSMLSFFPDVGRISPPPPPGGLNPTR
jgi:hypothetical protein